MNFAGKVVLITGAGSGIDANTAHHLAELGAKVSIVDINEKGLNEVAEKITKAGLSKPLPIAADVTKDCPRIIDSTVKHFGQLDVLVNNAGIFRSDSVVNFDVNEFDRLMNINLRSVLVLTNLAVPYLAKTKGNIVNISSVAGLRASGDYTTYCITKAGIDQLTKCAAITLASKGIRVNAVNPTPIYGGIGLKETDYDQFFKNNGSIIKDRVGKASDISSAVAYLTSQSFVNGASFLIDGGMLCTEIPFNPPK